MSACLSARGLTFSYPGGAGRGEEAAAPFIRGFDLDVAEGELVGLLGPNGAGKTTVLRLLAGFLTPRAGSVALFGRPLAGMRPAERARLMAFVPQGFRPAFDFTALELVLMGRAPHLGLLGIEGPRDLDIAREALSFTDAERFAARRFDTLSAGEKQRVLLARALAQQARLVLLDEPTAHLDLGHQVQFHDLLGRLSAQRRATILVASHDLNLAARTCGRVVVLHEGRVAAAGAPAEVLTESLIRDTWSVAVRVSREPGLGPVIVPLPSAPAGGGTPTDAGAHDGGGRR